MVSPVALRPTSLCLVTLLACAAVPSRAQINLAPTTVTAIPDGSSFIIGVGLIEGAPTDGDTVFTYQGGDYVYAYDLAAIPEPSTWAVLAGLVALGFVALRRRARLPD